MLAGASWVYEDRLRSDVRFCSITRMDKCPARGITGTATSAKRVIQQNPTVSIACRTRLASRKPLQGDGDHAVPRTDVDPVDLDLVMDLPGNRLFTVRGATFQHQAVRRRDDRAVPKEASDDWFMVPFSQPSNASSWPRRSTSGRALVLLAPHPAHLQRVRPADVTPLRLSPQPQSTHREEFPAPPAGTSLRAKRAPSYGPQCWEASPSTFCPKPPAWRRANYLAMR